MVDITENLTERSAEIGAERLVDLRCMNIHIEWSPDGVIRGQMVEGDATMEAVSE